MSRPDSLATSETSEPYRPARRRLLFAAVVLLAQSVCVWEATRKDPLYSDELYHAAQIRRFCVGPTEEPPPTPKDLAKAARLRRLGAKDPKLAGKLKRAARLHRFFVAHPYALHPAITTLPGYHIIVAALGRLLGDCSLAMLRAINVGFGLIVAALAWFILTELRAEHALARSVGVYFLPILYPHYFVAFTDACALAFALGSIFLALHRRFSAAALVGALATSIRQTNVVVLLMCAALALFEHDKSGPRLAWMLAYFRKIWLAVLVLAGFLAFVVWNGGVALGDKSSHQPGFHLANLFFGSALAVFVSMPANLEIGWRSRARLRSRPFLALLAVAYLAFMTGFTIDHRYNKLPGFLRNALLMWAVENPFHKTLFFVPVALGLMFVWTTAWSRRGNWLVPALSLLLLLPDSLVEQRYAILPIASWLLLRRDASASAELLAAITNAILGGLLLWVMASGTFRL